MPPQESNTSTPLGTVVDKIKSANNVLVTVSTDPSVDQLAACIGLTLVLTKQGKHATAVFSGKVPSTIDFLEPDKTIEKNTDSLRDFIISLDKSKADKLRYKVENDVVKIFITPYKTSISEKDLDFSQGDFNVDVIVAIGVHDKNQLDAAILAHGRILHDAVIICINTADGNELGAIDWIAKDASSLSEMVTDIVRELSKDVLDAQIATALLTGIVSETERFRNDKASPHTMSVAGALMSAGASTQLVSTKLEQSSRVAEQQPEQIDEEVPNPDGMIQIDHDGAEEIPPVQPGVEDDEDDDQIHIDEEGKLHKIEAEEELPAEKSEPEYEEARTYLTAPPADEKSDKASDITAPADGSRPGPSMVLEPPQLGGQLTANTEPQDRQYSGSSDPLSAPSGQSTNTPILGRATATDVPPIAPILPEPPVPEAEAPQPAEPLVSPNIDGEQTLTDIEKAVASPHLEPAPSIDTASLDSARDAVMQASDDTLQPYAPEPIAALNAQPVDLDLHHENDGIAGLQFDENDGSDSPKDSSSSEDKPDPPPVPPPLMPV